LRFVESPIVGAFVVEPESITDERGFFARTFCREEFSAHGLDPTLVQCSVSFNVLRGTLRGMHFQRKPHEEVKLVRCTMGAVHDVIVDLRPGSPTYRRWHGIELTALNHRALYIPEGVAHGFLTLQDASEVFYQMAHAFQPGSAAGVRWDDPAFAIAWPGEVRVISDRDRAFPDFVP
jgi:dTDP-4-dehydrorhamnose 3,5-epimerase